MRISDAKWGVTVVQPIMPNLELYGNENQWQ